MEIIPFKIADFWNTVKTPGVIGVITVAIMGNVGRDIFYRSISRLIKMANRDVELAEDCDGMKEQSERNYQLPAFSSPLRRGALPTQARYVKAGGKKGENVYYHHQIRRT